KSRRPSANAAREFRPLARPSCRKTGENAASRMEWVHELVIHAARTPLHPSPSQAERGMRAALTGLSVNAALVVVKLLAGILAHSYALIPAAIESPTDIFPPLVVWAGRRVTPRPADEEYPYGYGRAETLAAAVVSLMLLGAALGIAAAAVGEIVTPHHLPAP